ncbi:MAG: hypothetical protein K0U74_15240 [Alphaproteobacteria bacterium]|nr:hypothetical protein [Alphaproteobacteria bacterium]
MELIKPRVLAKLMKRRENKNFDLKIVFDRILPEGKLAESETLTNFSELAERARNTPLRLDETEFGNLLEKVAERLKSSDYAFDHLIIAKENWNAPLNAASSVIEVLNAGEARGKTGSWLSIYSKFTAAHGNSFLSAAVNRSGGGRLFSERAKKTENPIPRRLQFLSALRGTVQNRALREELAGAKKKPARKVTIDLNSVTEPNGTGHLIAREQMSQFRKKLQLLLDRLKYDTDRDTGDGGLSLGEYFLKADPPFIKLPATAPVRYRRRNPLSAMTKDEIRTFNRNLTKLLNSRGFTSPKRCAAYFLRDKDLGADGL